MLSPLLLLLLAAAPAPRSASYVFSWRGVPVGQVTLALDGRRFTYTSEHLHTREGHVGTRRQQQVLTLDAAGTGDIAGRLARPQALWLWQGPPATGCVLAMEELSGREGPHCVERRTARSASGTLLGQPFQAAYAADGQLQALTVGTAHFTRVAPGRRLRAPPDLFAHGLLIEEDPRAQAPREQGSSGPGSSREGSSAQGSGALAFVPALAPGPAPALSAWREAPARALASEVNAQLPDKRPSAADLGAQGPAEDGGAGGCLAHALRYARLAAALGQRVALVHGLLAGEDGRAYPHAWVRVGLAGGGTLDLDPTSLEEVRPQTHLPLALAAPEAGDVEAGERWLRLLSGAQRVVRR